VPAERGIPVVLAEVSCQYDIFLCGEYGCTFDSIMGVLKLIHDTPESVDDLLKRGIVDSDDTSPERFGVLTVKCESTRRLCWIQADGVAKGSHRCSFEMMILSMVGDEPPIDRTRAG
jgi:hypothetical protein